MAQINPMITSEIGGLSDTSKEMADFLKWLLEFEREHIDKELYVYKGEIEKKLVQLIGTNEELKTSI